MGAIIEFTGGLRCLGCGKQIDPLRSRLFRSNTIREATHCARCTPRPTLVYDAGHGPRQDRHFAVIEGFLTPAE